MKHFDRLASGEITPALICFTDITSFGEIARGKDLKVTHDLLSQVADIADEGISSLAKALSQPTERHLASLIRYRDPSMEGQEHRHYGAAGRGSLRSSGPAPV